MPGCGVPPISKVIFTLQSRARRSHEDGAAWGDVASYLLETRGRGVSYGERRCVACPGPRPTCTSRLPTRPSSPRRTLREAFSPALFFLFFFFFRSFWSVSFPLNRPPHTHTSPRSCELVPQTNLCVTELLPKVWITARRSGQPLLS